MTAIGTRERPLLLLHIPKTGGTTISKALYDSEWFRSAPERPSAGPTARFVNRGVFHYPGGFYKVPAGHGAPHQAELARMDGIRAVLGHFSYGVRLGGTGQARLVTLVRDPVERIHSLFAHLQRDSLHPSIDLMTFVTDCPVDGWVAALRAWDPGDSTSSEDEIRRASRALVDNDQVRRISGEEPPFRRCTRSMLERAKTLLRDEFALVGTTERLDETWLLLGHALGARHVMPYYSLLVDGERARGGPPSAEAVAAINEGNELDVELYAFARSLIEERIEREQTWLEERLVELRTINAELRRAVFVRDGIDPGRIDGPG